MKLEVGKTYIARNGDEIYIRAKRINKNDAISFVGEYINESAPIKCLPILDECGNYLFNGQQSAYDIISEKQSEYKTDTSTQEQIQELNDRINVMSSLIMAMGEHIDEKIKSAIHDYECKVSFQEQRKVANKHALQQQEDASKLSWWWNR